MNQCHRYARLVLACLLFIGAAAARDVPDAEVVIAGERFELELALDPVARNRGLMFRDHIDKNGGMLFVFPQSHPRRFWMANCLVDMDILFLDDEGTVTTVLEMFAEPLPRDDETPAAYYARLPRYPSDGPARFAIELKHGTTGRLGVKVGDRVEMDVDGLAALAR